MKDRSAFFAARVAAATAVAILLAGCSSAESRSRQAFSEYQAAAAAGDLNGAQLALLRLVAAEDGVADYWAELGKIQLELGSTEDAFYAFTRAHELDRGNVENLAALTQLALLSGNLDVAEDKARHLELVAPTHPAVSLTYGYVALRRSDLDQAEKHAEELLRQFPFDTNSKMLKARILLARDQQEQAAALLEEQVRSRPTDATSLKALTLLYERSGRWDAVAAAANRLVRLNPNNLDAALLAIRAAFLSGDSSAAIRTSLELLRPDASGEQVDQVLSLWADHWRMPAAVEQARRLARLAGPHQHLAYATYFNRVGSPADAAALVGNAPQLPVTLANSSSNAILAESLALRGRTDEALRLFNAVLAKEPDHGYALRGRIRLLIKAGRAKAAIQDAQRLVSIFPRTASDRLLLAQVHVAAGDHRQADRTLWDAFHEIPANPEIYEALLAHAAKSSGPEAARRVKAEFDQQRDLVLQREFA